MSNYRVRVVKGQGTSTERSREYLGVIQIEKTHHEKGIDAQLMFKRGTEAEPAQVDVVSIPRDGDAIYLMDDDNNGKTVDALYWPPKAKELKAL